MSDWPPAVLAARWQDAAEPRRCRSSSMSRRDRPRRIQTEAPFVSGRRRRQPLRIGRGTPPPSFLPKCAHPTSRCHADEDSSQPLARSDRRTTRFARFWRRRPWRPVLDLAGTVMAGPPSRTCRSRSMSVRGSHHDHFDLRRARRCDGRRHRPSREIRFPAAVHPDLRNLELMSRLASTGATQRLVRASLIPATGVTEDCAMRSRLRLSRRKARPKRPALFRRCVAASRQTRLLVYAIAKARTADNRIVGQGSPSTNSGGMLGERGDMTPT